MKIMRATDLIENVPGFRGAFSFFVHIAGDPDACITGVDRCQCCIHHGMTLLRYFPLLRVKSVSAR